MSLSRKHLGSSGEEATARLYESRGYSVLARNWRCRLGELDLILALGDLLVFCEVKSRRGSGFGGGYEAVTEAKRRKLRQLAEAFLAGLPAVPGAVRFDVASVGFRAGRAADVELFEDAF